MYQPGWIIYVHKALCNLQHEASFFFTLLFAVLATLTGI